MTASTQPKGAILKHAMQLAGLALLGLAPLMAQAQTPQPGAILEQQRDTREFQRRQDELERQRQAPQDAVQDEVSTDGTVKRAPANGASFLLKKVATTSSEVFSAAEIAVITAPYVGHQVKIADLFQLVADFNQAYREKKVIGAKAVLPPQKIKDGVVQIRLVEAKVGAVRVGQTKSTNPDYITDRLALEPGGIVYLDDLEAQLFRFNTLNDVEIRAVLKPGETFGSTDYEVRVVEPPRRKYNLFVDNAGTRDTGVFRVGVNYSDNSLTGRRDVLGLGVHLSEGSKGGYVSYNRPVGVQGTRVGASMDFSAIDIIHGPLVPLNVTGESWNIGLFVTHPVHVGREYVMNVFGGLNAKESSTDFDGVTLFDTDVRTLSTGVDAESYDLEGSWYQRHYVTFGPNAVGNDKRFAKYNAEGSWMRILSNHWVVTLRGKAQIADTRLLPSSEQFQVGGMSTVRGYPEGLLIGDRGYMMSAEASIPWPDEESFGNPFAAKLRALAFIDHGAAFAFKGNNEGIDRDDFLTSAGIGMQINLGARLKGRILLATPLYQRRDDNHDGPRLHVYLESTPF